jgi:ribonuclease BN (tRNA processing enzyme)
MVRVTVLGSCGAWPQAGRACSGYLLESNGTNIVLDLGFGTLSRLFEFVRAEQVRAVFVTHAHADHCVDLFGLYRARALPTPPFPPLPIYARPDLLDRVGALGGPDGVDRLRTETEFHPLSEESDVTVGPFRVRAFGLPHFVPNLGFRVEVDDGVIAYTGDTGPSPRIVELARDADLFLCEATYQGAPRGPESKLLTATEAGRYARDARVRQLLLTHFWPNDDRSLSLAEAAGEFPGKVVLAEEGLVTSVTGPSSS